MSLLDKSHKLGPLDFEKNRLSSDSYTDLIPKNISEIVSTHQEYSCCIEPGDAVIFHKDMIQKSNYNSTDLCRLVGLSSLTQSADGEWGMKNPEDL
jgi:hypothetical protein